MILENHQSLAIEDINAVLFSNKLKIPSQNGKSARNSSLFDTKKLPKILLVAAPTGYGKSCAVIGMTRRFCFTKKWLD